MNKLKTILIAACSLVLVSVGGIANADSSNFAGPYVGVTGSGYGIELGGEARSTRNNAAGETSLEHDKVSIGKVTPVMGIEAGYALPLGAGFLLDVGGAYHSGEAKIDHEGDDSDSLRQVSFKIDDLVTMYIAPTLVLSDTSALYVKMGVTSADIGVSGDITTPGNLEGELWGIGTRTQLDSGIFVRTEAGYTEYNAISVTGKGTTIQTSTTYSADPTSAYGTVSLGFRF